MDINLYLSVAERKGYFNWMPTPIFLKYKYHRITGKKLNLDEPVTFSEKMQKLKLIYAKSSELGRYTELADKIKAKELASKIIGEKYVIPTLGVWDNFDDIPFDLLPEKFVLKTNHDSGGVVLCMDKANFDKEKAKKKLEKSLKRNFYWYGREPQYNKIKPRILAEQLLGNAREGVSDYKVWCFNGVPKLTLVCSDRLSDSGVCEDFYDLEWNHMPIKRPSIANSANNIPCPMSYQTMLSLAEKLSKGIPFARIDFYEINNCVYLGEITFFPASGFRPFIPDEWDTVFGNWLQLPL